MYDYNTLLIWLISYLKMNLVFNALALNIYKMPYRVIATAVINYVWFYTFLIKYNRNYCTATALLLLYHFLFESIMWNKSINRQSTATKYDKIIAIIYYLSNSTTSTWAIIRLNVYLFHQLWSLVRLEEKSLLCQLIYQYFVEISTIVQRSPLVDMSNQQNKPFKVIVLILKEVT